MRSFGTQHRFIVAMILLSGGLGFAAEPVLVLDLPGTEGDPEKIDYAALPRLEGTHAVISAASRNPSSTAPDSDPRGYRFELHNYLVRHEDMFWCIWSDGPVIEDEPTQEVRYATSRDGLTWSESRSVTGTPDAPYAFIARGLWLRDGEMLALAAHYKGKGAFGADKQLELWAFVWDQKAGVWRLKDRIYDNAINNFAPQRLPSGEWIVTRRDARFNVSVLIGGRQSLSDWRSFPVVNVGEVPGFRPDEPIFWPLPDRSLFALCRDNGGSQRLFHCTSHDEGRTWSTPVITNFPNATSKLYSLQTSRGYRVLILNANPKVGRRELHLAVSPNGRRFTRLALLAIPSPPPSDATSNASMKRRFEAGIASLQYPHAIEQDGQLLIAFSRNKLQTELLRVPLDSIDALVEE